MSEAELAPEGAGQDNSPAAEGQAQAWYDSAADEVKGYIQNKGWDDPMKAVEAYQNLEKFHGVPADQLLKLPKEGEPLDPVYDRLGRPESPDAYELSLPDGTQINQDYVDNFKSLAHSIGLNQEQVNQLAAYQTEYESQYRQAVQEQTLQEQTAQMDQLKQEWGSKFEERVELGRRFIRNYLPDDADKEATLNAIESAMGTANMLKFFGNAGARVGEDKIPESGGDRPFGYTREQAMADRAALMSELSSDKERLANYNQGIGPDYDKMQRILKIMSS